MAENTWSSASLSTIATLTKHEQEISRLTTAGNGLTVVSNFPVIETTGVSSSVYNITDQQGNLEFVVEANSVCNIFGNAYMKLLHSDDNETFEDYKTDTYIIRHVETDERLTWFEDDIITRYVIPSDCYDYIKFKFVGDDQNDGYLNVYSIAVWQDKIDLAKQMLGDKLEIILKDRGVSVDEADGKVLLDTIQNPTVFNLASDYLTLHLIYLDLSRMQADSYYTAKAKLYNEKYNEKFDADIRRMNLDLNEDGEADIRRVDWQLRFTH